MTIDERIKEAKIIPVIAIEDAEDTALLLKALEKGGLRVAEFTFRTKAAREAIRIAAQEFPDFAVGAGTVTRREELDAAVQAGAQFGVAPGFNAKIVARAQELNFPFFPGVCTASEIEAALESGCQLLKYFPAGAMGGMEMIKALYGPFSHRKVQFIPTGGVTAANLAEYLSHPSIAAVGGTWLVTKKLLADKNWAEITRLTAEAVQIAAGVK